MLDKKGGLCYDKCIKFWGYACTKSPNSVPRCFVVVSNDDDTFRQILIQEEL